MTTYFYFATSCQSQKENRFIGKPGVTTAAISRRLSSLSKELTEDGVFHSDKGFSLQVLISEHDLSIPILDFEKLVLEVLERCQDISHLPGTSRKEYFVTTRQGVDSITQTLKEVAILYKAQGTSVENSQDLLKEFTIAIEQQIDFYIEQQQAGLQDEPPLAA